MSYAENISKDKEKSTEDKLKTRVVTDPAERERLLRLLKCKNRFGFDDAPVWLYGERPQPKATSDEDINYSSLEEEPEARPAPPKVENDDIREGDFAYFAEAMGAGMARVSRYRC